MQKWTLSLTRRCCVRNYRSLHHVCIVGSGPAGFYTAGRLLKAHPEVRVDILERSAAPFGLVRYGVSPDHQDVKNVTNTFTQTLQNERVHLLANVRVGSDVKLSELLSTYSCVVLAAGATGEKSLNIPGEQGSGVYGSQLLVDWYNGGATQNESRFTSLASDLSQQQNESGGKEQVTVCVIGNGNVALDIARTILTKPASLAKTDITQRALDVLHRSAVRKMLIVGRRGVLNAAFTIAEIREILKCTDFLTRFEIRDFNQIDKPMLASLSRPLRRRTQLLLEHARRVAEGEAVANSDTSRQLHFLFNHQPVQIVRNAQGRPTAVHFRYTPESPDAPVQVQVECDVVVKSLGYALNLEDFRDDLSVPVDQTTGAVANAAGRVLGVNGLYCAGWLKTGPRGVIATTMTDAFETAGSILDDLRSGKLKDVRDASAKVRQLVESRGPHHVVDFNGWKRIDEHERRTGAKLAKVREKLLVTDDCLKVATSQNSSD